MKNKIVKELISWGLLLVLAFGLALFINKVIIYKVKIPSASMETTIMTEDKVLTYRLAYLFGDPKRGDIVVFPLPDDESRDYIKRVIGLPGETIEGVEGRVKINGEYLDEPYINGKDNSEQSTFGPYIIPADCYFMMGDNRDVSEDARYWENKFVTRNKIIGKAMFRYKPDFKWLNKKINYNLNQDNQ